IGWSNSAFSSRRAMVRIGLTSALRLAGQLVEQVLEARRRLVQLVQRPATGLGESVDLGPQVGRAVGREGDRDAPIRGRARSHVAHAGEPAERLRDAAAGGLHGDFDGALGLPDQPVHGSVGHDLSAADDEQPGAGVLDFREHVRRQDHRAVLAERADQAPDLDALVRVEPLGGLVEHQQIGAVQDRLRQAHPLAIALGQLADRPVVHRLDPGAGHGLVQGLTTPGARELAGAGRRQALDEAVTGTGIETVYYRPIGELSKGYRQRVGLAQAILHRPDLLVLDEPTEGLDPNQRLEIRRLIGALGKDRTVILSTHVLPEVQHTCSRLLIISRGKIVADGPVERLIQQAEGAVEIAVEAAGTGVAEALGQLPGVRHVSPAGPPTNGRVAVTLTADRSTDLRPEIFGLAKARGWTLYELHQAAGSLEDLFHQLTSEPER